MKYFLALVLAFCMSGCIDVDAERRACEARGDTVIESFDTGNRHTVICVPRGYTGPIPVPNGGRR